MILCLSKTSAGRLGLTSKPRRSKYGAVRTRVGQRVFHSRKEARRYVELVALEKAGEIEELACQVKFPLRVLLTTGTVGGAAKALTGAYPTIGHYVADFVYRRNGQNIVEDVKGYDTPLSRWKRKHVAAQYGMRVQIV